MPTWSSERASLHVLDRSKYTGDRAWKRSEWQVFRLAEDDFLYNCRAFKHVVPCTPLSEEDSPMYMHEKWRKHKRDLRFFHCRHCRQNSKTEFCEDVSSCNIYSLQTDEVNRVLLHLHISHHILSVALPGCDHHDSGMNSVS